MELIKSLKVIMKSKKNDLEEFKKSRAHVWILGNKRQSIFCGLDCVKCHFSTDDKNQSHALELINPKSKRGWWIGCFGFNGKNPSLYQFKTFDGFSWNKCFQALDIKIWWDHQLTEESFIV